MTSTSWHTEITSKDLETNILVQNPLIVPNKAKSLNHNLEQSIINNEGHNDYISYSYIVAAYFRRLLIGPTVNLA